MAKKRFQVTAKKMRLGMLGAALLGLAVVVNAADQHPVKSPAGTATAAPKYRSAKPARVKTGRSSAQRQKASPHDEADLLTGGKRDPFKLPEIPTGKGGGSGVFDSIANGNLPPGVRGLMIAQLRLEGVVRESAANKMIAVVTNDTKRAYFLTVNESVYNGTVTKITPDAVYFTENVLDGSGRVTSHEVVKRLGAAPGEGR